MKKIRFSEIGKILQEKEIKPGDKEEVFSLKIPEDYVGFLYYIANDYAPLKLNIDGEEMKINEVIPIKSPNLFNPPFLVEDYIKVYCKNESEKSINVKFYADGIAYSVLSPSEERLIQEMNEVKKNLKQPKQGQEDELSAHVKTEEARPRFPHIVNHYLKNADTWYEIKLPKVGVKSWNLKCRENYDINYCFEPSHSTYMTLARGSTLSEDTAPEGVHAIYVKCPNASGVTIEFELWREE